MAYIRTAEIRSFEDQLFTLRIFVDNGFNVKTIKVDSNNCNLKYSGPQELYSGIYASKLSIGFIADLADSELFADMLISPENKYSMKLTHGDDLLYSGYIHFDNFSYDDDKNAGYRIAATDSLAKLKDVDFIFNQGWVTYAEIIKYCIDAISVVDIHDSAKMLYAAYSWKEQNMVSNDLLNNTRIHTGKLQKQDSNGNISYKSCWDVLSQMLDNLNARFYYHRGKFYFEQFDSLDESTLYYEYNELYELAKTTLINRVLDLDAGVYKKQGVSQRNLIPALKKVEVKYAFNPNINLLLGENLKDGVDVIVDGGSKYKLAFNIISNTQVLTNELHIVYHIYRLKFKVGDEYLNREIKLDDMSFLTDYEFLLADDSYYYIAVKAGRFEFQNNSTSSKLFTFNAQFDIPANYYSGLIDGTEGFVKIEYWKSYDVHQKMELPNWHAGFSVSGKVLEYVPEPNEDLEDFRIFTAKNPDEFGFSKVKKFTTDSGDGPTEKSNERIQIRNGVSTWIDSEFWDRSEEGVYYDINQLRANATIAYYKLPLEVLNINIWGPFSHGFQSVVKIYGKLFCCTDLNHNFPSAAMDGRWIEFKRLPISDVINDPVIIGTVGSGLVDPTPSNNDDDPPTIVNITPDDTLFAGGFGAGYLGGPQNTTYGIGTFSDYTGIGFVVNYTVADILIQKGFILLDGVHGFVGDANGKIPLIYNSPDGAIIDLPDNAYEFEVIDANTLKLSNNIGFEVSQNPAHVLQLQKLQQFSNVGLFGYQANPDADNQIALGDDRISSLKVGGIKINTTAAEEGSSFVMKEGELKLVKEFHEVGQATKTYVPSFTLPDPAEYLESEIRSMLKIWINGRKQLFNIGFTITHNINQINIPWNIDPRDIEIEYFQKF